MLALRRRAGSVGRQLSRRAGRPSGLSVVSGADSEVPPSPFGPRIAASPFPGSGMGGAIDEHARRAVAHATVASTIEP
jgi:hypothetical protein